MMKKHKYIIHKIGSELRVAICLSFFIICLALIYRCIRSGNKVVAAYLAVPALASGLIAGFMLCGPLADFFSRFFVSFLFSGGKAGRPMPKYSIPESKRAWGHYEEAISEYEKIAEEYPDEIKPYADMVEIAMLKLKDMDRATRIYERGMARLKKKYTREVLSQIYLANCSRIEGDPEWLKQEKEHVIKVKKIVRHEPVEEPDGLTKKRFHVGGYERK